MWVPSKAGVIRGTLSRVRYALIGRIDFILPGEGRYDTFPDLAV